MLEERKFVAKVYCEDAYDCAARGLPVDDIALNLVEYSQLQEPHAQLPGIPALVKKTDWLGVVETTARALGYNPHEH